MFRVSKYVVPVIVIMTFILACSLSAPAKNKQENNQIPVTGEQTPLVVDCSNRTAASTDLRVDCGADCDS